jgi:FG-GAP-like repeat
MPVSGKIGTLKFTRMDLNNLNLAEATTFGDYNKDGRVDLLSGPYWWEGPTFEKVHQLEPPSCTPANPMACNCYTCTTLGDWAEYSYDVDGDGWIDSIHVSRPGTPSYWDKNPGMPAVQTDTNWAKRTIGTLTWEQSAFADMAGKGVPGLVGVTNGEFGWLDPGTNSPWTFHLIAMSIVGPWEHGLGVGNIQGTSMDFLSRDGWWSPPAGGPTSGSWTMHPQTFKGMGANGGSQMFGYDVNGDGQTDVITALDAHGYGVAWFEQQNGTFVEHDIVGGPGATNNAGGIPSFSQPHDLLVTDVDGDGLKDIITGKVFYAHPPGVDPGAADPPVFYVFKLIRGAQGAVTWEPHLVDMEVGLGKGGLSATDFNGDGLMDIAVASKHGVFLFFQQ